MFGLVFLAVEVVVISAYGAATVAVIGACAAAIVSVIKALHEVRDEHQAMKAEAVDAASKAKDAAMEARVTTETSNQFVRGDLKQITDQIVKLDRKVTNQIVTLGHQVQQQGKGLDALLEMVVSVDEKMDKHIEESRKYGAP